ncbi:hypothetical protein [Streptomyces sp. TRM68416]|uniref:hypothetical protein n=1 Tax=Streptomyces sp. TRM68416 TaxID=2758412 RepID=UPI001661ED74|nr:hypothetical protein [Streptomyces sp. TRM68416]MBD0838122.1 hypothetical protein [Streptomyces sp. TRM68416]
MKRPGPLLTLLTGLALAVLMLSLNATTGTRSTSAETSPSPAPTSTPPPPTVTPSASPSPTPVPDGRYAGRTDDDSAAIALTLRDGGAVAYFCDGRTRESWLKGDVEDDGSMRLTGKDGSVLNGTLKEDNRISGTVDVGDGQHGFTADRAKKPSGPYRATATVDGTQVDGGWIVLQGGRQVGIVTRDGTPSPAPSIDPETGAVTVDGQQLTARPATP